jgi:hypothetical protein
MRRGMRGRRGRRRGERRNRCRRENARTSDIIARGTSSYNQSQVTRWRYTCPNVVLHQFIANGVWEFGLVVIVSIAVENGENVGDGGESRRVGRGGDAVVADGSFHRFPAGQELHIFLH